MRASASNESVTVVMPFSPFAPGAPQGGPASVPATTEYAYQYDDIGNRITSTDLGTNRTYTANGLNQYTLISNLCDSVTLCDDFVPQYDLDGNQTLVKTSTGIWSVTYNGENRPIHWSNGSTNIVMSFDRMGRRVIKNNQRFVYDGYLQVADNGGTVYIWDPTKKVATRPLVWFCGGSVAYYIHDGNKNVSEVIDLGGAIGAHYEYAPFGVLTKAMGECAFCNPWRFSSEHADDCLSLVYYNYRHYESVIGRWMCRDPIEEMGGKSLYEFVGNSAIDEYDSLGLFGDGYKMVCVEWKKVRVRSVRGRPRKRKVCKKWIKQNLPWKGHSQFTNNGTECPFDYTKEDYGWSSPYIMPWRHFQDKPESESKVNAAISACNADAFERAMHQLQDYFTHRGKGYEWHKGGHIFDGTKPDEDNEAWDKAEEETKKKIEEWNANCCLGCPKKDCKWIKKSERKCAE